MAFANVKMVVLAPMPRVSERTATAVNPGAFASIRRPYLMSCIIVFMLSPQH